MASAREQREACPGGRLILRLGQDPPPDRNHGIGCEDERAGMARRDFAAFGKGEAAGVVGRPFAFACGFDFDFAAAAFFGFGITTSLPFAFDFPSNPASVCPISAGLCTV